LDILLARGLLLITCVLHSPLSSSGAKLVIALAASTGCNSSVETVYKLDHG
jgi:hypothetical protein